MFMLFYLIQGAYIGGNTGDSNHGVAGAINTGLLLLILEMKIFFLKIEINTD
jgi:hypothetical protein